MSVANLPRSLFVLYILSALYRRLKGRIADLMPFCVVADNVALALFGPINHTSANDSADNCLCRSLDTKVLSIPGVLR